MKPSLCLDPEIGTYEKSIQIRNFRNGTFTKKGNFHNGRFSVKIVVEVPRADGVYARSAGIYLGSSSSGV